MAKILKEYQIKANKDETICTIVMDYCTETKEGYGIELYFGDTSESTTFGNSEQSANICDDLFNSLKNFGDDCLSKSKGESSKFWELFNDQFQTSWILTNEDGVSSTSITELERLFRFISIWKNHDSNMVEVIIPKVAAESFSEAKDGIAFIENAYTKDSNGLSMGSFIENIELNGNIETISNIWGYLLSRWEGDTIQHYNDEHNLEYQVGNSFYL